jgi:hypothetical protein
METHKRYIDYAITMISSSGFYVSNTLVSTTFTSIIHINFNGEQNGDPRGSGVGAGWRWFPRVWRCGSVTMISRSSLETSWQWCGCGGAARQRSHRAQWSGSGTMISGSPSESRGGGGAEGSWQCVPRWWFAGAATELRGGGCTVGVEYDL